MRLYHLLAATASLSLLLTVIHASSAPAKKQSQTEGQASASAAQGPNRQMSRGEYIAREALSYRGTPYVFGGTTRRGIDCSALSQAACRKWGYMLPRTSVEQFHRGVPVHKNELRPGDLLFFKNTYKHGISHVGIYIGDGKFVHAAGRRKGVIVSSLSELHYEHHLAGARRLALDKEPVHEEETAPAEPMPGVEVDTAKAGPAQPAAQAAGPEGRRPVNPPASQPGPGETDTSPGGAPQR